MIWIAALVLSLEYGFVGGMPYVGVEGGSGYLNWTVTNLPTDGNLLIRNPADNASLVVFTSSTIPIKIDTRANFTGDLLRGIVSFTLSNITLLDAGNYTLKYTTVDKNASYGGQVLVVAVSPNILGIIPLSSIAVAGKEYKLNCSAESRSAPLDHNLTMNTEWNKNGVNITMESGYSVNGTILTISNLSRNDDMNNVTCRAFEDRRTISVESKASVLSVLYGPDIVQVSPSSVLTVREGLSMNITCTAECNPPCGSYQWQKDSSSIVVGRSQSYVIPEVMRNHSGVYICTVTNTNISKNATAQITVKINYGPDAGSIILSPTQMLYELVESSSLSVNCSADCYPRCQYGWTGPGIDSNGNTGVLSIPQIKKDQAGVHTCTATNPEITKYATAIIFVNVLYGPDAGSITLSPNQSLFERVENSSLFVNCSADCYPNCQYKWTGRGLGNYGNTSVLYITQIKRDQAGVITCTAMNPRITNMSTSANISLSVFYGPDDLLQLIPVNTSYRLVEETTLSDITCTSSCFPTCEFHWTGPVPSLTGVMSLGKVNRSVRGNYTCSGRNPRTQNLRNSTVVTVTIIYGPDTPVLTPRDIKYTLNESNILPNIQCFSECFPGCRTYWYKHQSNVPVIKADTLSLGDVFRYDSGEYICKSENKESNTTNGKVIQLIVQYPPTVSIASQNGTFNETGLTLNCSAHGIPERYNYSLIHSSLYSGDKIRQIIYNEPISTEFFGHSFMYPSIMDTGVYTCIVRNGILDYKDGSLDKNASVTVLIEGPPTVTSIDTEFYADKGDSGRLVIEFYNSLLEVNITWYIKRNQTMKTLESSTNKYNISTTKINITVKFYSVLVQQPGFITTLEIKNVTEDDFSTYQVFLQNSAGNVSDLTLNLKRRGRPDVPTDFHIVPNRILTRSVDLAWVPGFHGGSNQTFVIEFKNQKDERWTNYSQDVFGGMMQNKYFNITVEELDENTVYFFQLYAWNVFGRSDNSNIINATTYAESSTQGISDNGSYGAIIGGVTGAVVLLSIVAAVLVLILYRRRRDKKENGDGTHLELDARSGDINNRNSVGLVDNLLYTSTVADHATVIMPPKNEDVMVDSSSLYAQVDKTNTNWTKGAAKGKQSKTSRGDVYENIGLGGTSVNSDRRHENPWQTRAKNNDGNIYENPGAVASDSLLVHKDGLLYADLMLDPPTTNNGKIIVRGLENRTNYAEIAYGKRGQPLPDEEEEKVDNGKK